MRIAHVSDIHIRMLRYHDEYRRVFDNLYEKLREFKPDLVVNTGDTVHQKTNMSPEMVQMLSEHIRSVATIAPYHVILGNHDLNLMNRDRQDAISPVVDSMKVGTEPIPVFLHKKSGRFCPEERKDGYGLDTGVNFWVFGMADSENYPRPSQWAEYSSDVNIGLFHGSISRCVTDSNWRMTHTEYDLEIFDGLDFVMMGDIHKQQFFNDRRIAYAGSLIQQNFGEETDKGFLLWDIESKTEHTVRHVSLEGSRKFYTVRLNDDLSLPQREIEVGSRIRVSPPRDLTLAEQKEVEKNVRHTYSPKDVITLSAANIGSQRASIGKSRVPMENIRQLSVQERLIRDYMSCRSVPEKVIERALDMNRRYQINIDQDNETVRDVSWKINKICWSNMFNYGEENVIDFSCLGGLTGIFAPNASGKSNLIDVILETCFDNTTRGINKNIFLVNDNKEQAVMIADVTANGEDYVIERVIEKLKYGQRKFGETKEWGKTTTNFYMVDDVGEKTPLVGTLRPETEKNIRHRVGNYDDFLLTALSAQWNPLDIISCKETDRKKILYRFLDLDVFEEKHRMSKDEGRQYQKQLTEMEEANLETLSEKLKAKVFALRDEIEKGKVILAAYAMRDRELEEQIGELSAKKVKVSSDLDERTVAGELAVVRLRKDSLSKEIGNLHDRLSGAENELEKISKLEQKFDLELHRDAETALTNVERELSSRKKALSHESADLAAHRKSLKLLEEVPCGNQFPQCKFLVDAFRSQERLPTLEQGFVDLQGEITYLEEKREELLRLVEKLKLYREFVSNRSTIETSVTNIRLQLENAQLKMSSLDEKEKEYLSVLDRIRQVEDDIIKNAALDVDIASLRDERKSVDAHTRVQREEIEKLNRQMGSEEGVLEKIEHQLSLLTELRETCNAYERYSEAMGKDGIAYQIMTQKLPLINEEINKILGNSADFGVVIEHDQTEQSIHVYLQYGEYKMRMLELGSGAEKMLASVAIRAALLSISSLPKPNMFVIDEGFGKLDVRNMENIHKMFDYLKTVFEHVFVISHVDTMKDMVDNIIEISTDTEGYAHVAVGG